MVETGTKPLLEWVREWQLEQESRAPGSRPLTGFKGKHLLQREVAPRETVLHR